MAREWKEITDGTFKGFVFHVATPTKGFDTHGQSSETVTSGRKLQKINRPFQSGMRVRDLGATGREVTSELIFIGTGYQRRFDDFAKVLNEGTSGVLVLPDKDPISAMFESMVETASIQKGNGKSVRITWVEDEISDDIIAVGAAVGIVPKGLIESVSVFEQTIENARSVALNNPVLATIRQIESITSVAVNSVVLATSLTAAVRDRVLTTIANLEDAYQTVSDAFRQLLGIFETTEPGSGFESGRIDEENGQSIEDGLEDETVIEPADPLEVPPRVPSQTIAVRSLETEPGLLDFQEQTIELLQSSVESIQVDTAGRTEDVSESVEDVINAVRDVIQSVTPTRDRRVLTPIELSLAEVMFENGVDLSTIDEILAKNTFLNDPNIVPAQSVITL